MTAIGLTKMKSAVTAVLCALAAVTTGAVQAQDNDNTHLNLMLMGSAPQVCSSINQAACAETDWIEANDMRTTRLFNLSDVRRREAMRQGLWPREREQVREAVIEALEQLADHFGYGVVSEQRLVDRLRSRAHLHLLADLTEDEYFRILDGLEMPTVEGLQEVAHIGHTAGSGGQLIQRFVNETARLANTETPLIYVVTAGQRDPLGSYAVQAATLRAAGAEPKWLPIDATVRQAQTSNNCESLDSLRRSVTGAYDRARVHPTLDAQQRAFCEDSEAWQDALNEADGIYFTDGNQSLLRAAFFDMEGEATSLLNALQRKVHNGEVMVAAAGNSAIAMSSGTMLTNGTSREALSEGALSRPAPTVGCERDNSCPRGVGANSLTYQAMGGLGLYPYGLIDVEMSERGRQGRMLRLAADTATPLALGIDRDTAILVNPPHGVFEVIGEAGVLIAEQVTGNHEMVGGSFHYVRQGATGILQRSQATQISLVEQPAFRPESITTRFLDDTGVFDNIARLCEGREQLQLLQEDFVFMMRVSEDSTAQGQRGRCQVINGVVGIARN